MADYAPKVGDRVRVVLEGVVKEEINTFGIKMDNDAGQWLAELYIDRPGVTVEKIEPPVETFGPGDVVRDRSIPKYTYYIGRDGYLDIYNKGLWNEGGGTFTSEHYEKVSLHESPF